MNSLIPLVLLLSMKTTFGMKQTGTCRLLCTGTDCISLNKARVDFETAEAACRGKSGELVAFQPETEKNILDILSQESDGDFWIGLRLPAGACSNLSAPLKGYEWTAGGAQANFLPSATAWTDSVRVCSPHCVSLSRDQRWAERLCSDKADGFLCREKRKDARQARELSDANVFRSSESCLAGPCEHECTDVEGGYKCSCFRGYIPDSKDPRQCKIHCAQQTCPAICTRGECLCAEGFIRTDRTCEDINECSMDGCDQGCTNTFGSFVCFCEEGFVLKDQVKCIKTTPDVRGSVQPAGNNATLKGSSAPAGSLLWIWISLVVVVTVFIIVLRFYVVKRQKHREQNSSQQPAVPVLNTEC